MSEVHINEAAIKIAKLGFNGATETDLRNMILDTSRGRYVGIYQPPTALNMSNFVLTSTISNSSTTTKKYTNTVSLGKTFDVPPAVFVMYKSQRFSGALPYFSESNASLVNDGALTIAQGGVVRAGYSVTTKSIIFVYFQTYYARNPSILPGPSAITYFVAY